jgi:hypothetical protein
LGSEDGTGPLRDSVRGDFPAAAAIWLTLAHISATT